jgi:hypothetical protein
MMKAIENNEVEIEKRKDGSYSIRSKQYLKDENGQQRKGKPLSVMNGPFTQEGTEEIRKLFKKDVFPFPKPSNLIKYFFDLTINEKEDEESIYMDFFAGSAPSAEALLKLNFENPNIKRKFICVQLPELTEEGSVARKEGYNTIADVAKEKGYAKWQDYYNKDRSIDKKIIPKISKAGGGMIIPKRMSMGGGVKGYPMGGLIPYKAEGGFFKSLGSDTIPAMLTPGEIVVRRPAVKGFGKDNLEKINRGTYEGNSVYNYNLSVNVASQSDPNVIAQTVMGQIRSIDSQRIRGNRF